VKLVFKINRMLIDKYNHISFDLDGTLIHTTPEYIHKIVPAVVNKLGGKITDKYHIDRFWFEHNRDRMILGHFNVEPAAFWKVFWAADTTEKRIKYIKPYNDSERTIRKLKELGKLVSIITGAPKQLADLEIGKLNGAKIDLCLSLNYTEEPKAKPDPSGLNIVIDKIKSTKKETLYIGNSSEDALFAKNAGVDFVHIERNEHKFDLRK
jgi:phosphoglycolate phosphatase-like HAD superfamily hydrolase